MPEKRTVVRPPTIAGVPEPRPIDRLRIALWYGRGFLHGALHGQSAGARALSVTMAGLWVPAVPLLVSMQMAMASRQSARYYMTPERDAVLAIVATRTGWQVEDHSSARPGSGRGRALRDLVLPELMKHADTHGIAVTANAASAALAQRYLTEISGLTDAGPAFPRGRTLRREPAPESVTQESQAVAPQQLSAPAATGDPHAPTASESGRSRGEPETTHHQAEKRTEISAEARAAAAFTHPAVGTTARAAPRPAAATARIPQRGRDQETHPRSR
jgi:hypothetical protein